MRVLRDGATLTTQWVNINTLTGNLEDGTMQTMDQTPSIIFNDVIVSYGYYDSGPGVAGLPNSDQCYVTVAPNNSNWLAIAAPAGSPAADKPFRRLVLPAVHDVGMNSMQNCVALIQGAPTAIVGIILSREGKAIDDIAKAVNKEAMYRLAPNIIRALAITQKDTLPYMLALGARYFEFRPAHIHSAILPMSVLPDVLYFQHGAIPGMAYKQFLNEIVQFLIEHPLEIVVVQIRYDGIPNECKRPTDQELNTEIDTALSQIAHGAITTGAMNDMQQLSINQLRSAGKRLILLNGTNQYSTYTDTGNATLNGDSIIAEFNKLNTDEQNRHDLTVIQCQATATNIKDVVAYSVLTANVSTSPLLATKPVCDGKTLPWIRNKALDSLKGDKLVVVMNDFFDGATADVTIGLSGRKLQ